MKRDSLVPELNAGHAVKVTVNPGGSYYTTVGGVQLLKMQSIFILEGEGFKVNSMVFNQWNGTEK